MSNLEQAEYAAEVNQWLARYEEMYARLQVWEASAVKEYRHGIDLVCAFQNYIATADAARRSQGMRYVSTIHGYLKAIAERTEIRNLKVIHAAEAHRKHFAVVPQTVLDDNGKPVSSGEMTLEDFIEPVDGRRPQHLDQYMHLLSPELQAALTDPVSGIRQLFLERAEAHSQAQAADELGKTAEFIAPYTERVIECDTAIRLLFKRADAEYERIQAAGKAPVDASPVVAEEPKKPAGKLVAPDKAAIDAMPDGEEKGVAKNKRIENNRKYTRRTDLKTTEANLAQLRLRMAELDAWGVEYTLSAENRAALDAQPQA